MVGLEHRGVQVGDGRAGRRQDGHGRTGAAGQAQGQEPRAALVDPHVQSQAAGPLGGEHGVGQRRRPGAGAQDDLADAVPHQLVDQDRREGGGRGHERGFCHPLSTRSSDTERTGRPSTSPAEACQASRPATVPRGAPSATRRVVDVATEPVAAHVDGRVVTGGANGDPRRAVGVRGEVEARHRVVTPLDREHPGRRRHGEQPDRRPAGDDVGDPVTRGEAGVARQGGGEDAALAVTHEDHRVGRRGTRAGPAPSHLECGGDPGGGEGGVSGDGPHVGGDVERVGARAG